MLVCDRKSINSKSLPSIRCVYTLPVIHFKSEQLFVAGSYIYIRAYMLYIHLAGSREDCNVGTLERGERGPRTSGHGPQILIFIPNEIQILNQAAYCAPWWRQMKATGSSLRRGLQERRRDRKSQDERKYEGRKRKERKRRRKRGEPPVTAYPPVLISRCLQIGDKITYSR